MRWWWKLLLALLVVGVAGFAALEVYINLHAKTWVAEGPGAPETMIIFGCQVKPEGPSVLLKDRLDTALSYWEQHPDVKIVVTGGKGDDEHQSEAQCMYDYLTAHGVDGGNIYREDQSRNTHQNVSYTQKLLYENAADIQPMGKVVLVSSDFHLARIQLLWERAFAGTPLAHASRLAAPVSHTPSRVQMFFREPLALVKSYLFDREFPYNGQVVPEGAPQIER